MVCKLPQRTRVGPIDMYNDIKNLFLTVLMMIWIQKQGKSSTWVIHKNVPRYIIKIQIVYKNWAGSSKDTACVTLITDRHRETVWIRDHTRELWDDNGETMSRLMEARFYYQITP